MLILVLHGSKTNQSCSLICNERRSEAYSTNHSRETYIYVGQTKATSSLLINAGCTAMLSLLIYLIIAAQPASSFTIRWRQHHQAQPMPVPSSSSQQHPGFRRCWCRCLDYLLYPQLGRPGPHIG
jgi:hypothetical protein